MIIRRETGDGKILAVLVGMGLLLAGGNAAYAQTATLLPVKGTREIGISANAFLNGDRPYAVAGTYGVFTSPELEFGVTGGVSGAARTRTFSSLGGFANYYLRGSDAIERSKPLLPYVGAFAGYSHQESSDTSIGAQAGAKYFFNPNVALTGEIQYRSTRHGSGNTQLLLGLSTFFR